MNLLSKFEKYKKKTELIYPHKHCLKCNKMISETIEYCDKCFQKIQQEKKEKEMKGSIFKRFKNKIKKSVSKKL